MLIGVQLPITEENVKNIDAYQLLKAHDMFLNNALSGDFGGDFKNQYLICRKEILRRLTVVDKI